MNKQPSQEREASSANGFVYVIAGRYFAVENLNSVTS